MNTLEKIKCFTCHRELTDFMILPCGHNICDSCLEANKTITSQLISISCKCGLLTNMNKSKSSSPRSSLLSAHLNQTLSTLVNKTPKANQAQSLILDETQFMIAEKSPKNKPKQNHNHMKNASKEIQYLMKELSNQIKFVQIKFDRYLNQATRNFNQLIISMKDMFFKFKQEVKQNCEHQISRMNIRNIAELSNNINIGYQTSIQPIILKLTSNISKYSAETKIHKPVHHDQDKSIPKKTGLKQKSISKKKSQSRAHLHCKNSSSDLITYVEKTPKYRKGIQHKFENKDRKVELKRMKKP